MGDNTEALVVEQAGLGPGLEVDLGRGKPGIGGGRQRFGDDFDDAALVGAFELTSHVRGEREPNRNADGLASSKLSTIEVTQLLSARAFKRAWVSSRIVPGIKPGVD